MRARTLIMAIVAWGVPACGGGSDGGNGPEIVAGEATTLPVPTAVGLPTVVGFSVNAELQPHGLPAVWRVEYGRTTAYGTTTEDRPLPGRLAAHYVEDWATGTSGWLAGFSGAQLTQQPSGGPDDGPFVRRVQEDGAGNDVNHLDGIGLIHLGPYMYLGNFYWAEVPPLYLGGGFPDLRGAKVSAYLRGVDWSPHGTELGTWIQGYRDPRNVEVLPEDSRYPNWAFTGDPQTDHMASGAWERAEWVLRNRTQDWTFAGSYGGRLLYDYGELDTILRGVNVDMFLLQVLHVDINDLPTGIFDTAQLNLTYRQHSLCADSNGGTLVAEPAGGTGAASLTDGYRFGADHEWQSAANPTGPQTFELTFAQPVTIFSLDVHNATLNPSREIEVSVSEDDGATWTSVASGTLPDAHELGPNYAFFHADTWVLVDEVAVWAPLHPNPVDRLRVEVLSGYQTERWGLGEIEAFGLGATEQTDDDWYDVNQDVIVAPGTWHYRVAATTSAGTRYGPDQIVEVPGPSAAVHPGD